MLQVTMSLATVVFSLGLDQAYVREYHGSLDRPAVLLNAFAPGCAFLIVVVMAIFWIDPGALAYWLFAISSGSYSIIITLCLLASFASRFLSLILRMQDRGLAYSVSQILPKAALLFILATIALSATHHGFGSLLAAQAAAVITAMVVFSINTAKTWIAAAKSHLSVDRMKWLLKFGYPLIFGGLASWGFAALDRVMLRSLASYEELAVYSVAMSVAAAVTIFTGVFNTIWTPLVYRWEAERSGLGQIERISRYLLAAIAILVPLTGLGSCVISRLLPPAYAQVCYIVVGCVMSPLMYALSEVTGIGIGLSRKTGYSMAASFAALVVNVVVGYVVISWWGARGAAVATMLSFFVFFGCRTEFSIMAWKNLPRLRHYLVLVVLIAASSAYAFFGSEWPVLSRLLWGALAMIFCVVFRREVVGAFDYSMISCRHAVGK